MDINLFIYKLRDYNYNNIEPFFSEYRINKIKNTNNEMTKLNHIKIEFLIKLSLEKYLNTNINKLDFIINQYGKPILSRSDCFINISHKNDILVIAISKNDVGVDIEKVDSKYQKIATKIYNNDNYNNYSTNIDKIINDWTILESFVKLIGKNMYIDLKTLKITDFNIIDQKNNVYFYKSIKIESDYYITVASNLEFNLKVNK